MVEYKVEKLFPRIIIFSQNFFNQNYNLTKKMGCDGGTIPKRDELVRTKKKKAEVV